MPHTNLTVKLLAAALLFAPPCTPIVLATEPANPPVVIRLPPGGVQPRAVLDAHGKLHIVYFKGAADGGDLFYSTASRSDLARLSPPHRVNALPGSACAIGTIRGAQIAVDDKGTIYVVWNGSRRTTIGGAVPFLFTRLLPGANSFEPERNLLAPGQLIDGGGAVAALTNGSLFVFWHALKKGEPEGMGRVYATHSEDGGKTFKSPLPIDSPGAGTCACCGMQALARGNSIYVLYRSARNEIDRDTTLLRSSDGGRRFISRTVDGLKANTCPVTLFSLASSGDKLVAAWETKGEIRYADLLGSDVQRRVPDNNVQAVQTGSQLEDKFPSIASTGRNTVLAWVQTHGWASTSTARWIVLNDRLNIVGEGKEEVPLPPWTFCTSVALDRDKVAVIY